MTDSPAPNISIAGLKIWVHSRQFSDANDYWDSNWLMVTVDCREQGAMVQTSGAIIHLSELEGWLSECERLYADLQGEAQLACMEPELSVRLTTKPIGHLEMVVEITPDHLRQRHQFIFEIDQSFLPPLIQSLKQVLVAYPVMYKDKMNV